MKNDGFAKGDDILMMMVMMTIMMMMTKLLLLLMMMMMIKLEILTIKTKKYCHFCSDSHKNHDNDNINDSISDFTSKRDKISTQNCIN